MVHHNHIVVVVVAAVCIVAFTASLGSVFTRRALDDRAWYERARPRFSPPDAVFPAVWTFLYALLAVALSRILLRAGGWTSVAAWLFFANLAMNVAWCYAYFARRDPGAALGVFVPLLASTVAVMYLCRGDAVVVACMAPYLMWLSFAFFLNWNTKKPETATS